jgi:hypothetical protein
MTRIYFIFTIFVATFAAAQQLEITSPSSNSVVTPGEKVIVKVTAGPEVQVLGVSGDLPIPGVQQTPSPNQFLLTIPAKIRLGTYKLTAFGISNRQPMESAPVVLRVDFRTNPVGIDVGPAVLYLGHVGDDYPLDVKGLFSDGSSLDISHSAQVVYTSKDPKVATVSRDGRVTAVGTGETVIMVQAGLTAPRSSGAVMVRVPVQPSSAQAPVIADVSPTSGVPGITRVTVTGTGFGAEQGAGWVQIGTQNGHVISWSDTKIVATIDPWAGPAVVSVSQSGKNSNNIPFRIEAPVIQGVEPIALTIGSQATVIGSGFGDAQGSGFVQTANTRAPILSWSDSRIVITIPPGTANGHLYVRQNGINSHPVNLYIHPR